MSTLRRSQNRVLAGAILASLALTPSAVLANGDNGTRTQLVDDETVSQTFGPTMVFHFLPVNILPTAVDIAMGSIGRAHLTVQGKPNPANPPQKPATPPAAPAQTPAAQPAAQQPAAPPAAAPPPLTDAQGNRLVSNSYTDTDIKQAFADLSAAADVTVSPDDSVTGNVTANFKNVTVPQALDILTVAGGYSWKKIGDVYLVGKAEPSSPNFFRFAATRIYKPDYTTAEKIASLLPTGEAAYVKTAAGERTITITAGSNMMDRIVSDIKLLDTAPARIVLEAMVTEIDESKENKFNFSWNWRYFGLSTDGTTSNTISYAKASAADVATIVAAINNGSAELKASPRVMSEDGKEATMDVSQEQWFEAVSGPVGFAYSQLQQIKTGITLKVTPYMSDDGQITMVLIPP